MRTIRVSEVVYSSLSEIKTMQEKKIGIRLSYSEVVSLILRRII